MYFGQNTFVIEDMPGKHRLEIGVLIRRKCDAMSQSGFYEPARRSRDRRWRIRLLSEKNADCTGGAVSSLCVCRVVFLPEAASEVSSPKSPLINSEQRVELGLPALQVGCHLLTSSSISLGSGRGPSLWVQ